MAIPWQNIFNIIGAVGGLCGLSGLWSVRYARRQTALMVKQAQKQEAQDKEELDWSERFDRLANQLVKINPGFCIKPPGYEREVYLYSSLFPDATFCEALETYIVQPNASRTQFSRRNPRPDELRRATLRETIGRAEQRMAEFQKQNPKIDLKYYMRQ